MKQDRPIPDAKRVAASARKQLQGQQIDPDKFTSWIPIEKPIQRAKSFGADLGARLAQTQTHLLNFCLFQRLDSTRRKVASASPGSQSSVLLSNEGH